MINDTEKYRVVFNTMVDIFDCLIERFIEECGVCKKSKGQKEHDLDIDILHGYYSILYHIAGQFEVHDEVFETNLIEELKLKSSQEIEKLYFSVT